MTQAEQKNAAKKFVENWNGKGYEKGESQKFWLDLLCNVFGIQDFSTFVFFENQIKDKIQDKTITNFIDVYIPSTKVMIEQKSSGKDLRKPIKQSDGSFLTPFQQAKKYIAGLPLSQHPRWVVTCNFEEFLVYDMEQPNGEPESILLKDLEKEYYRLSFLTEQENIHIKKELEVSKKAGDIIGEIYDAILSQYKDAQNPSPSTLKSLNMLCVRIVFCLYAEDAGIFGHKSIFGDYLKSFEAKDLRRALLDLFQILDQKIEERDEYLEENLAAFPYVNGGLFTEEDKTIPPLTEDIKELLVKHASSEFDWSEISPTIFGAIFESTLNPDTRRKGGMHYTSIENIHKVIDPLFMDELNAEFEAIASTGSATSSKARSLSGVEGKKLSPKQRIEALHAFQEKLGSLKFLDPACGSGNFLTETYLSLRRLENKVINILNNGEKFLAFDDFIKVQINQFYGIEINDFAAVVAKTALWIAESQMMAETANILHKNLDFLPLKSYANIIEGNALRIDWETIVPKNELNYIMGNPPFVGGMYMNNAQKEDITDIFKNVQGVGEMDYVCAWYKKSAELMKDSEIKTAFVSTNSICQGQQVITFWKYMFEHYTLHIDFAHETFVWNSESNENAKVHCVIVGFSLNNTKKIECKLYSSNARFKLCKNISPYLTDTPNVFIESRSNTLCKVSPIKFGSMPRDGGGFVLTEDERTDLIKREPLAEKWIKPYIGAVEFLNNKKRYCLWLVNASPAEIKKCPTVLKRVEEIRDFRASSKAAGTRKFAETPTLFCQIAQPDSDYIIVPKTSSGKRKYIPLGFMDKDTIASDLVFLIPNGTLYEFGVLSSNVHNAWMRVVAGRLKSDYRYSKDIVYNNFPWCNPTDEQKAKIEQTAQAILDARANYPECSLADLYDELTMPPELRKAHQANDRAVMEAYHFDKLSDHASITLSNHKFDMTESEIVAALFKMYEKLVEGK